MRILFQFLSSQQNLPGMLRTIGPHLDSVRDPTTELLIGGTSNGGLADDYRTFETIDAVDAIGSVLARAPGSFDVLAIGNSLDAGLAELRELLDVPVLAYLEANLATAGMVGDRVALLVPTRAFVPRYRGLARMYGCEERFAGAYSLDFDRIPQMNALFDGDAGASASLDRLLAVMEEVATRSGADVLLPCGPPALFLAANRIHAAGSAAVLDGFATLCKLAEAMGGLARAGMPFSARHLVHRRIVDELRPVATEVFSRYGEAPSGS